MTNIDKIEESLKRGTSIQFHISRDGKEPAVFVLVFDRQYDGADGYNLLRETYENKKTTLVIFQHGDTLDISIIAKETGDAINIKNLKYDKSQLTDFLSTQPKDSRFAFMIGFLDNGELILLATKKPFSAIVVDKYEIK